MSKFGILPTRFVRQFTTGQRQDKTNYILIMQNLLGGLQTTQWKKSFSKLDSVGMPNHNFAGGPYIDDSYDAYKMCGEYNSSDMTYIGYAGCVAYRFKVPDSYYGHYQSGVLEIKNITIPIARDRYLKTGSKIHVVASDSENPSSDWDVISASKEAYGGDTSIFMSGNIQSQGSVKYLVDSSPTTENLQIDVLSKAQVIASKKYIYVYLVLNSYTDYWTDYNSKEKRMYAIEGASAFAPFDFSFEFNGQCDPDKDINEDRDNGGSPLKKIILETAGFIGTAAITVGLLWYGGQDSTGNLMPDAWENSFAVLAAISDPAERARYATAGDYMAYADIEMGLLVASNKVTGVVASYAYDSMAYPYISVGATLTNVEAKTSFPYGDTIGIGTNVTLGTSYVVTGFAPKREYRLVHFQVYDRFGYESGVATSRGTRHTKAFTALDKYLVARFMMEQGIGPGEASAATNAVSPLAYTTLVPGVADFDGDSINDGLELYMMFGPNQHSLANNHLSAWRKEDGISDYDNDGLTAAQELGGDVSPLNPWKFITNPNTLIDTYAYLYNIRSSSDGMRDDDGDGLSNYAEYLVSKVFGFSELDPYQKYTSSASVPDYFRKKGELYYGEIFHDHDRVDDTWEQKYSEWANAAVYDPDRDDDKDGWGNYDEFMAGTHPGKQTVVGIDGLIYDAMPVPICKMNLKYYGAQRSSGPIVVIAESTNRLEYVKWSLGGVPTNGTANAALADNSRYVGMHGEKKREYHFGNGVIINGTFKGRFKVLNYEIGDVIDEKFVLSKYGDPEKSAWVDIIVDKNGKLYDTQKNEEVGTIDYENGLVSVDYTKSCLNQYVVVESTTSKTNVVVNGVTNEIETVKMTRMNLGEAHVNFTWKERAVQLNAESVKYFSVADMNSDGTHNWLKKQPYTFSAFIDNDGNGTYTAGEPYGCAVGVTPGFDKCEFDIEMTDTITITPRFNLWNSETSDRGETFDESIKMLLSDRTKKWDASEAEAAGADTKIEETIYEQVVGENAEKDKVSVRIVRFGVNDMFAYLLGVGFGGGTLGSPEPIVAERTFYKEQSPFVSEKDFYMDGEFDLDWTRLRSEVITDQGVIDGVGNVTNVTYLAVLPGGEGHEYWIKGSYDSNTVIKCSKTIIERRFEKTKHAPVALNTAICYGARPTFRWSLPNEEAYAKKYGTSYTAFNLEIYGGSTANSNNLIYASGIKRAPAQDENGVFTWTADMSVGDMRRVNKVFSATSNYCWRVAMYNAKFKPGANDTMSAVQTFSMAVNDCQEINDHGYSSIDVAVKYAGQTSVIEDYQDISDLNDKVRVQAFATADCAGDPLAEVIVTSGVNNFESAAIPNARLIGLPATGTYYVRAYIDSNGNHQLDDWESWGIAKEAVALTTSTAKAPVVSVWIEDCDTDNDKYPDSYEYTMFDGLTEWDANIKANNETIFTTAWFNAATNNLASLSAYLDGSTLGLFVNGGWAKALLKDGDKYGTITFADINNAVFQQAAMRNTYVRIDDATLGDNGVVTLTTENGKTAHEVIDPMYYVASPNGHLATVGISVQRRASLAEQNWTTVGTYDIPVSVTDAVKTYSTGLTIDKTNYIYRVILQAGPSSTDQLTLLRYGTTDVYKHVVGEMSLTSQEKSGLTYCRIGTDVTSIADDCFYTDYTNTLSSVIIPSSVTNIGKYAFYGTLLTSVIIPHSVKEIGQQAFYDSCISNVTILGSVSSFGPACFGSCSNLVTMQVSYHNPTLDSRSNCNAIIETASNKMIVGCKNTTIPSTVTSIARNCFSRCFSLERITIPDSITNIGQYAFSKCSGLVEITSLRSVPPECNVPSFTSVPLDIPRLRPSQFCQRISGGARMV